MCVCTFFTAHEAMQLDLAGAFKPLINVLRLIVSNETQKSGSKRLKNSN